MERPLAPAELSEFVCPHLWPLVAALQREGQVPSLAVFDIKAHILTLEYPVAAQKVLAAPGLSTVAPDLQCSADGAVCRCCTQSLVFV
jgi:hypothetical protein